jgi:hypothetical protein
MHVSVLEPPAWAGRNGPGADWRPHTGVPFPGILPAARSDGQRREQQGVRGRSALPGSTDGVPQRTEKGGAWRLAAPVGRSKLVPDDAILTHGRGPGRRSLEHRLSDPHGRGGVRDRAPAVDATRPARGPEELMGRGAGPAPPACGPRPGTCMVRQSTLYFIRRGDRSSFFQAPPIGTSLSSRYCVGTAPVMVPVPEQRSAVAGSTRPGTDECSITNNKSFSNLCDENVN